MKKFFKYLIINFLVFIFLIFLLDITIYCYYSITYRWAHHSEFPIPKFSYVVKPYYGIDFKTYFDGSNNVFKGRTPDGLEYKRTPIVVFGCSYAHGQFLDYNQTFTYKLSHLLQRPVYNRAVPGHGIGLMYWQSIDDNFYNSVPPSDMVIYIINYDHYRRLFINFIDVLDLHMTGHFNKKGDNLILDGSNYLKNILISSYTFKVFNNKYVDWYINNTKHEDEITDLVVFYFTKTRKNLETRWNNRINFTIIFYNDKNMPYKNTLFKKLENNGFKIIETDKILDIDLNSKEYKNPSNLHPTEKVWDIITPEIIKNLNL